MQAQKDFLLIADQVHLVDCHEHVGNSKQGCNVGMTAGLRKQTFGAVHKNHCKVRRGSARGHVARVLFVSGRVGNDELPLWRLEIAVGNIDRNSLFAFGAEAIGEKREIDWTSGTIHTALLDGCKLILVDALCVMQ